MKKAFIGSAAVSRIAIGGNQISGFSHQGDDRSREMRSWFTTDRVCEFLAHAEDSGVNTIFARSDDHVIGLLEEYWRRGGTIQWFAQITNVVQGDTTPEENWQDWLQKAAGAGATALYLHGGVSDFWYAQNEFDRFEKFSRLAKSYSRVTGFAAHTPDAHGWIRDNMERDFQMCSYYNPTDRTASPHHISHGESWVPEHRTLMASMIETIDLPVVHYKVFAGGNLPIEEAFAFMGQTVRPADVVLLGIFPGDNRNQLTTDIELFDRYVDRA